MKKYNTLKEVFRFYPYIKKHRKNITRPSLKGCTINEDHHLSMEWVIWHRVIKIYLKYLALYVLSGRNVVLPHGIGIFRMYKYKYNNSKRIDYAHLTKTGEIKYHKNNHTNGHIPLFKWHRGIGQSTMPHKWLWATRMIKSFRKLVSSKIFEDPTLLATYSYPPKGPWNIKARVHSNLKHE